jgi:NADH-quinone oxidoreductase subunit F
VIGGGNTAIDAARTALRLGADKVFLLYRRLRGMMPAFESEVEEALKEGVELLELIQPVKIMPDKKGRVAKIQCARMALGEFDPDGRRRSVEAEAVTEAEGSGFFIDADTVIPAVSQYADFPFIRADNIGTTSWGTFIVDDSSMMTSMEGVFAGGDVVRGPGAVVQAIADGKKASVAIDKYLGGSGFLNKGPEIVINPFYDEDDDVEELGRYPLDMLDLRRRRESFEEVVLGYHKLTAMAESMRCLHCERRRQ